MKQCFQLRVFDESCESAVGVLPQFSGRHRFFPEASWSQLPVAQQPWRRNRSKRAASQRTDSGFENSNNFAASLVFPRSARLQLLCCYCCYCLLFFCYYYYLLSYCYCFLFLVILLLFVIVVVYCLFCFAILFLFLPYYSCLLFSCYCCYCLICCCEEAEVA